MVRALAAASTSALSAVASTSHQASPFSYLLRNSRFATFDPTIRQTYYSPKQFVTRGYWGLKRPIAARKKTASFITIKTWEARQHYVKWDNAEDRVRFVKRMEELGVRPGARTESAWMLGIGFEGKQDWVVDSDFAPRDWDKAKAKKELPPPPPPQEEINLDELGIEGPQQYGARARRGPSAVIPNVHAMSPPEFKRYLAHLRSLRPAFKEYLRREGELEAQRHEAKVKANPDKTLIRVPRLEGKSLLQIAQIQPSMDHRVFLAEHTTSQYQSSSNGKIQPQPHRNAALTYTHPSSLDTLFRTTPKPGIVLDELSAGRFEYLDEQVFVASFAGVAAVLPYEDAEGRSPLMDPEEGARKEDWPNAVTPLRPVTSSGLMLFDVPRVVGRGRGRDPDDGMDGVGVQLAVTADCGARDKRRPNPFPPGSREYNALQDVSQASEDGKHAAQSAARGPQTPPPPVRGQLPQYDPFRRQSVGTMYAPTPIHNTSESQTNRHTLATLQNLLDQGQNQVGDSDL
ncbi:hypothetical protein C8F01DRAFT_1360667 [Mycena amicta]|nr:hypothetical protein C8F01DRAFT_1360667 [Mycena amicta]